MFIPSMTVHEYRKRVARYMAELSFISSLPEEIIVEGFAVYDLHASFQKHFMRGACHGGLQHLMHTLPMLPRLQSIELWPEWVPLALEEMQDLIFSELLRRRARKASSTTRLPESCNDQVTRLPFDQPGSTA